MGIGTHRRGSRPLLAAGSVDLWRVVEIGGDGVAMTQTPQPPALPAVHYSSAERPSRAFDAVGKLLTIARGVRTEIPATWDLERQRQGVSLARCMAALHSVRSARALTHTSAALVHGLALPCPEPDVHINVPQPPRSAARTLPAVVYRSGRPPVIDPEGTGPSIRRHRLDLNESELEVVSGLPVTSLLRTAVDCAFDMPPDESVVVVDSAMRVLTRPDPREPVRSRATWRTVRLRLLEAVERQGSRRGAVRARAVAQMATPFAPRAAESVLRHLVVSAGLPVPLVRGAVLAGERMRSLDLVWPEHHLAMVVSDPAASPRDPLWDMGPGGHLETDRWTFLRVSTSELADRRTLLRRLVPAFPAQVRRTARPVKGLWE